MPNLLTIQTAVNNGKLLFMDRASDLADKLINGCTDCCDAELDCLAAYITVLEDDLRWGHNTSSTTANYNELNSIIGDYYDTYLVDGSVVGNNITYIVNSTNVYADVEAYLLSRPGYAPYKVFGSNLRWNTPYGYDPEEWDQA